MVRYGQHQGSCLSCKAPDSFLRRKGGGKKAPAFEHCCKRHPFRAPHARHPQKNFSNPASKTTYGGRALSYNTSLTAPTPYGVGFLGRGLAPPLVLLPKEHPQTDIQNSRTGRRSLPTAATAWYPIPGTCCLARSLRPAALPHRFPKKPATQIPEGTCKQGSAC